MTSTRQRRARRRRPGPAAAGAAPSVAAPSVAASSVAAAAPAPAVSLGLTDEVLATYAGALYAVVRADGRVGGEEGDAVRAAIRRRFGVDVDPEALFFARVTPEVLAAALRPADAFRASAPPDPRQVARTFVADAVAVVDATEGLDEATAGIIRRYAQALGASAEDVREAAPAMRAWV
ncbi:MAG: hypothetical protein KBG28_08285 [Kofleriaceae bacterium]|nr:hypothetical protein [Kofleriaceae bacterium]